MTNWIAEAIAVTGDVIETVRITVTDDDNLLQSGEGGTRWRIDGQSLASVPRVTLGFLDLDLNTARGLSVAALRVQSLDTTYYITDGIATADAVTDTGSFVGFGAALGESYVDFGFVPDDLRPWIADAYIIEGKIGATYSGVIGHAVVYDDDATIGFDDEAGAPAIFQVDGLGDPVAFDRLSDGTAEGLALVEVTYRPTDVPAETGEVRSFEALLVSADGENVLRDVIVPRVGSGDLLKIDAIVEIEVLSESPEGADLAAFGFGFDQIEVRYFDQVDITRGTQFHDRQLGEGGDDTLIGGHGEDSLAGDGGDDRLFGGLHRDRLAGGSGDDLLFGGSHADSLFGDTGKDLLRGGFENDRLDGGDQADRLLGGGGADSVVGGAGNDRIEGGKGGDRIDGGAGNDQISGGDGNDRLTDGTGSDRLSSNLGADRLIFLRDDARDFVLDFADGADRIDLQGSFASLQITTLAVGRVQIVDAGDVLIVTDTAQVITAANFTQADFL